MQIGCIKDIVTDSNVPRQLSPANEPMPHKVWLLLVAVYDDAVKLSIFGQLVRR